MSQPSRVSYRLCDLLPTDIEGFDSLAELALGYALVVESRYGRFVEAARSPTMGGHA